MPPIAAFVAAGFEHSIANLYFLPYALAIKAVCRARILGGHRARRRRPIRTLTIGSALHNIVVATIGNLVGGSLMVGAVYWFVYLRGQRDR